MADLWCRSLRSPVQRLAGAGLARTVILQPGLPMDDLPNWRSSLADAVAPRANLLRNAAVTTPATDEVRRRVLGFIAGVG